MTHFIGIATDKIFVTAMFEPCQKVPLNGGSDSLLETGTPNDRGGGTLVTHNPEQNDIKPGTKRPPIKNIYKRIPPEGRIYRAHACGKTFPYRRIEMPMERGGGFSYFGNDKAAPLSSADHETRQVFRYGKQKAPRLFNRDAVT